MTAFTSNIKFGPGTWRSVGTLTLPLSQKAMLERAIVTIKDSLANPSAFESGQNADWLREARILAYAFEGSEASEWIEFGAFCRMELDQDPTFGARHLDGLYGWPKLIENDDHVRSRSHNGDYFRHFVHVDELPIIMRNYCAYLAKIRR